MSNWISEIRWDESRNPPAPYRVYLVDGPGYKAGDRQYVPPIEAATATYAEATPRLKAWGESMMAAKPGKAFNHMSADATSWDSKSGQWKQSFDPTGLGIVGAGSIIGAGALGAGAGGGGAASSPTQAAMYGPNTSAMASQGVSSTVPLGSVGATTAGAGAAGAAGAAASGGTLGKIANWLKDNGGDLAALGIPAAAMAFGGNGGGSANIPPEISKLLAQAEARTRRADPLHQAAVQMAFGALPTYGRQGINLPKVELP